MNTEHTMTKKTFTAYGNCQADALAQVLMDHPEFSQEFVYRPLPHAHNLTASTVVLVLETVTSCDLLLYQNVLATGNLQQLTTRRILEAAPPKAIRLSMSPALIFHGYLPHLFLHHAVTSLFGNEHDTFILNGYLRGIDVETMAAILQDGELYEPDFSLRWMQSELSTTAKREQLLEVDLRASDYMHETWRAQRLFNGTLHPRRILLEHMAEQVIHRLGLSATHSPTGDHSEVLANATPPIYRSTYTALGLEFPEDFEQCLTTKGMLPLAQVIEHSMNDYARQDVRALALAAASQRPFVAERLDAMLAKHIRTPQLVKESGEQRLWSASTIAEDSQQQATNSTQPPRPPSNSISGLPIALTNTETDLIVAVNSRSSVQVTAAWHRWRTVTDLDRLPQEQFLLLPGLYANLRRFGLEDEIDKRIVGIYKRAWYFNQRSKQVADEVLTTLAAAGIPAVLAGAGSAALTLHAGVGDRPLDRFEILTLPGVVPEALEALMAAGWEPDHRAVTLIKHQTYRQWLSCTTLRREPGNSLELKWKILPAGSLCDFENRFYEIALEHSAGTVILSREAQSVLSAASASRGGPHRLLAISDASGLLQTDSPLNWDAMLELAYMLQVARPLSMLLATVSALFDLSVEHRVLARLAALGEDELPHESLPRAASGAAGWPAHLEFHRRRWRRIAKATKTPADARSLLAYVQAVAGAARPRDLPARLWQRWRQRPTPRRPHAPAHHTVSQQSDGR